MEFGIFSNGYIPGPAAHDTESEHTELMRESEYAVIADRNNWKYMWYGEHHGLVEYSHMSAPAPLMGWVAAQTERIHIGSAITSLPVTKEHPVRIAERAAMLDHVTNNRFEFGTGRGAGSHELMTFSGTQPSQPAFPFPGYPMISFHWPERSTPKNLPLPLPPPCSP